MDIHSSNQMKVMVQIFEIYTACKMKKSVMENFIFDAVLNLLVMYTVNKILTTTKREHFSNLELK